MKKQSAITLVALVITIIVMLILVGVTVIVVLNGGLFGTAKETANKYNKEIDFEQIRTAYSLQFQSEKESSNVENKTNKELFEDVKNSLNFEGATYNIVSEFMNIVKKDGTQYTLFADGTITEGKIAYLDIADGSIELKANGYIQGENELEEYVGKYILTGTTTENTVKVTEVGTYDITIQDLNIDVIEKGLCAFDANKNRIAEGCHVKITLEGENKLHSGEGAGLQCVGGKLESENSSSLILEGNGYLDAKCGGGYCGAGIGGFYSSIPVANIIINSGNYNLEGKTSGSGIGGGLRQPVGKITINGGNIVSKGGYASGIGTYSDGANIECLTINGGVLELVGGEYGSGINAPKQLIINGGTIIATTPKKYGIVIMEGGNATITGGNIFANGKENEISSIPTNGVNDVYLSQIKLKDVEDDKKITKIEISDNIQYGIKDMYTIEDGMLYLYLPVGTRTITVEAEGNIYSGTVETKEEAEVIVLNKQ